MSNGWYFFSGNVVFCSTAIKEVDEIMKRVNIPAFKTEGARIQKKIL